jgi:hypothetical protein
MLRLDVSNSRLIDGSFDEEFSEIAGRDAYCHKTMGYSRFSKEYRDCKAGLRQEDKTVKDDRKGKNTTSGTTTGDWETGTNVNSTTETKTSDNAGAPSSSAKDTNSDVRILGMEKPVAIPVIALSLVAITITGILIYKKLAN